MFFIHFAESAEKRERDIYRTFQEQNYFHFHTYEQNSPVVLSSNSSCLTTLQSHLVFLEITELYFYLHKRSRKSARGIMSTRGFPYRIANSKLLIQKYFPCWSIDVKCMSCPFGLTTPFS